MVDTINRAFKKIENADIKYFRCIFFVVIVGAIAVLFWVSDDAMQGYSQVVNLVRHGVFGYNFNERVNASTCVLFEILMIPLYYVTRSLFWSAFIINMSTSAVAIYILLFKLCKSRTHVAYSSIAILCSYFFLCFCSSGLENSLVFMLGAIFLYLYMSKDKFTHKDLIIFALLDSALLLSRLDMAVLFFFPTAYVYLFKRADKSIVKLLRDGFIGLLPLFCWLGFSLWYYGVPFPTTYYSKLNTGIPAVDYIKHGLHYIFANLAVEPIFFVIIVFALFESIRKGGAKHRIFAASIVLRLLYVIGIGGDFMFGRMLTDIFFFSICLYATVDNSILFKDSAKRISTVLILSVYVTSNVASVFLVSHYSGSGGSSLTYADERDYYNCVGSIQSQLNLPLLRKYPKGIFVPSFSGSYKNQIEHYENYSSFGYIDRDVQHGFVKALYPDIYITDSIALGDLFLAQLRVEEYDFQDYRENYRIGHNHRIIPDGYKETVENNENLIKDENLRQYYDIICELTRGDLFDKNRWRLIYDFNTGKYDYLVEAYHEEHAVQLHSGASKTN